MPAVWAAVVAAVATGCARVASGADASVLVGGAWRFTAVTDRLIRIEYDEDRAFVDDPTDAFIRSPNTGTWRGNSTVDPMGHGWAHVWTDEVAVWYLPDQPPATGTISLYSKDNNTIYHWGDDPSIGNLGGTARTLDNGAETLNLDCNEQVSAKMDNSQMHCTFGLISKLGWAVVNQTGAPVWHEDWYAPSRNTVDVFVFMHGLDFAGAMRDFTHAAGPPAVPPRYALGTMFTRWFNYDTDSVTALVEEFELRGFPLDAWIFDMNWHLFGPWGSFSWNRESYPDLQERLDWMKSKGLHIGANTHDHDGIAPDEVTYQQMCTALGRAPSEDIIPMDLYNKTFAMAQEDIAWKAIQTQGDKQGLDFAWIDYQQGERDKFEQTRIPGINPTIVLNRLRCTDAVRRGEDLRPMILSRWGGLGNHKYPVGFSGDQSHTWRGLAFLPYFTSTAANVAFGYWSHDTVGGDHALAKDYEFSVRWFQVSAWSPVLRMHDKGAGTGNCATKEVCARVIPWDVPNVFYSAIRSAAWKRDEMLPYIYTSAVDAASTGLTIVRPMYYEDPGDLSLYDRGKQYLFGPDMIVSPITVQSDDGQSNIGSGQALGVVKWSIHAPVRSRWVDVLNGDFVSGATAGVYGIHDVPRLARQGAVIPMRPKMPGESSTARARQSLSALEFQVMPSEAFYSGGSASGNGRAVDDDGLTSGYLRNELSTTWCNYTFLDGTFNFSIARTGSFPGMPKQVTLKLSFPQLPHMNATAGSSLGSVAYDHSILGPVVTIPNVEFTDTNSFFIQLRMDPAFSKTGLANMVGLLGRVRRLRYVKDAMDAANVPYGAGRANVTAGVLAAARMDASFAERLPQLWEGALAQASALLKGDKTLQSDSRRSAFIADMLDLSEGGLSQMDRPGTVVI